jgi:tRNA-Thr(GGU) m(6)t(6)A37 methyltransferase TsaA
MRIEYQPIGFVHSPFSSTNGMPNQPSQSGGTTGTVEVLEEFTEGLSDLDGYSHIILLCHFHQSRPHKLKVVPSDHDQLCGLFATRSPNRPNPIGLSVVRLDQVVENRLFITDVDILDGTPVLDIKPYVGEFARLKNARFGWLQKVRDQQWQSE